MSDLWEIVQTSQYRGIEFDIGVPATSFLNFGKLREPHSAFWKAWPTGDRLGAKISGYMLLGPRELGADERVDLVAALTRKAKAGIDRYLDSRQQAPVDVTVKPQEFTDEELEF